MKYSLQYCVNCIFSCKCTTTRTVQNLAMNSLKFTTYFANEQIETQKFCGCKTCVLNLVLASTTVLF
jgi:hypothetical protein